MTQTPIFDSSRSSEVIAEAIQRHFVSVKHSRATHSTTTACHTVSPRLIDGSTWRFGVGRRNGGCASTESTSGMESLPRTRGRSGPARDRPAAAYRDISDASQILVLSESTARAIFLPG